MGLQGLQGGETPTPVSCRKKEKSHYNTDDTSLFNIVPSFWCDHDSRSDNNATVGAEGLSTGEAKSQQLGRMRGEYTYLMKLELARQGARNT